MFFLKKKKSYVALATIWQKSSTTAISVSMNVLTKTEIVWVCCTILWGWRLKGYSIIQKAIMFTLCLKFPQNMSSFYGRGSSAPNYDATARRQVTFGTKSTGITGAYFINLGITRRLSWSQNHLVILSTDVLDWEFSTPTTRPLLPEPMPVTTKTR